MDLTDVIIFLFALYFLNLWWRRYSSSRSSQCRMNIPPGPKGWPLVGNLLQVIFQGRHFVFIMRDLRKKYGPIFTMQMGQRTMIIVTDEKLIHEALIQRGPTFASRPPDSPIRLIFSVGKCAINSAEYGSLWRILRRNFVTELVTPTRVKQCSWIRTWAMENHMKRIQTESVEKGFVEVMSQCRLTICSILICLCFGAKITEEKIKNIENVLKDVMLITSPKLPDFLPVFTPLFRRQVREARELRKTQLECLVPMIKNRRAFVDAKESPNEEMVSPIGAAYVDSLFTLKPVERGGELRDEEIVTLCSEIVSAGTDTSATTLEWALHHLVTDQNIQEKLYEEVVGVVGKNGVVEEDDVAKMPYLEAILDVCLRRTPYWIAYVKGKTCKTIKTFDFSKERFEILFLPPTTIESSKLVNSFSLGVFRRDKLSLLHESHVTGKIYLCVMKKHWSKLMTVSIPQSLMFPKCSSYFVENNEKDDECQNVENLSMDPLIVVLVLGFKEIEVEEMETMVEIDQV
ncbi:unnamed protein product [Brassica oleracea]